VFSENGGYGLHLNEHVLTVIHGFFHHAIASSSGLCFPARWLLFAHHGQRLTQALRNWVVGETIVPAKSYRFLILFE
jgi:hypothetical protein